MTVSASHLAPLRSLGVALTVTVTASTVAVLICHQLPEQVTTVEEALVTSCLLALVACVVWAWLAAISVVIEACAGGVGPRIPGLPPLVRRLLLAACGVAVAAALTQPAAASGDDADRDSLAGLPMPDRALGAGHSPVPAARSVVVRAGDCLWSLAARDLGPGATVGAVEARWRWIYRLNRTLIGPDPDLIRPGQLLELPPIP